MKKTFILVGALLVSASSVNAGDLFGAGWKPKPSVTLFGQKITWPIPSFCLGSKAGVLPDAGVSSDGFNFKIPYFAVDIPFPSLTVKAGTNVIELKVGAIEKNKQAPEK